MGDGLSQLSAMTIFQGETGCLWICTNGGDVNLLDKSSMAFERFNSGNSNLNNIPTRNLHVSPPLYRSKAAYFIYLITVVCFIWLYIRYMKNRIKLVSSLEYEKKEKKRIEELNQSKISFFTNVSHEFRTPLTLITTQIDTLLRNKKLQPEIVEQINSIRRNSIMMQELINELLDFRKVSDDQPPIKAGEYDLVQFIQEIFLTFKDFAKEKNIEFHFNSPTYTILTWFDKAQLQKVFRNLLFNTFKYTPHEGNVTVSINENESEVIVSVKDSGIGISPEDKERVFDQYFQVENNQNSRLRGSGLGLSLAKSIVAAHHGEIRLHSELNRGCNFEVILPKGFTHLSEDEKTVAMNLDQESITNIYYSSTEDNFHEKEASKETTNSILIVEDNEEMLGILYNLFKSTYQVITARNGEEGLLKTIEHLPDIVLSDLMMPIMSGSKMCLKIKTNFAVCHIPVVLLTAQADVEATIRSFQFGADDYITKPFDVSVLLARCNNLVNGRKILQEKYAKSDGLHTVAIASNEIDKGFLDNVNKVIEKNTDNPDFGVAEFSREMHMGRTSLFNKIKGVTGLTPNDFILTFKMKKATYLLVNNPELNISEITYRVGFNSPKYFSKCFKDQFGITPSEYKSRNLTA